MRAPPFLRVALAAGGALAAAHHALNAADVVKRLQPGETIRGDISGRVVNSYEIALEQGQYARVVVEHHGIALILRLVDAGVVVNETRTDEADGREVVEVASERATVYQIRVAARFPKADAGSYAITVGGIRPATDQDRLLHDARRQYAESNRLFQSGAYADAQAAAERALQMRERLLGEDHAGVAEALNQVAMISAERNDRAKAETLYRRALAINERVFGLNHPKVADTLDGMTRNARLRNEYAAGEKLGKRAIAIRTDHYGADHPMIVSSLGVLADLYAFKNDLRAADQLADRAFDIVSRMYGPDDQTYADFAIRSSRSKMLLGNFARAEELAIVALATTERLSAPDSPSVALAVVNLAGVYFNKGDNVKAEQTYPRAVDIYRKLFGNDHINIAVSLNNLGLLAFRRGDDESAERDFIQALEIRERLSPNDPLSGGILNNLGRIAWKKRDRANASAYYQRALEINEKAYGPDSLNVVAASVNLAIIAADSGDYEHAEASYKRALAIQERELGPNHPQFGLNVEGLGVVYRDKGEYARAEPLVLRALAITERSLGVDDPAIARNVSNLAQLYAAQGDYPRALPLLERLVAVQEKNLPLNLAVGSERQKLAYFEPFGNTLDKIISFQARDFASSSEARDLAATALLQRKGRILDAMADSLGALRRRSGAADIGLLDELSSVTSQLASLVVNGPQRASSDAYQPRIKTLAQKREAFEIGVSRRSSGYYEPSSALATLAAIRDAIPADAALVEFAVYRPFDPTKRTARGSDTGDSRYAAFVIRRTGAIGSKDLGLVRDVDEAVTALRLAIRDPQRDDVNARARALDQAVLQPLREMTGDATRLLISPDGSLNLVPFEALVDEHGRYLVERYAISYLTTGRDLLRLRVARASRTEPLIVADPFFGEPPPAVVTTEIRPTRLSARMTRRSVVVGDNLASVYFAPLAGTGVEARTIKSLFPEARLITGNAATKAALARADAPRILHIATHGFFLNPSGAVDNPLLRSGLALTGANLKHDAVGDGILTALEASNLNLWGTKLVTLSACDTGVGEVRAREGVYGLRRAFFLAGAETLVMSLWPVSDLVTREIMTAYYGGLRRGVGRGDALRQAQLAMLARANRRHPFYWASFIQAGEWANLDGRR